LFGRVGEAHHLAHQDQAITIANPSSETIHANIHFTHIRELPSVIVFPFSKNELQ
jgi:hypothetical protein